MYDVVIIGAGIIGGSIFRELSKYEINILALENENDVAMGATKANSAIIHAGFDPPVGTMMSKYNVSGNRMYENLCAELSVPYENNGALVIAFSENDLKAIEKLYSRGKAAGVSNLNILSKDETLKKEPSLNKEIFGALYAETSSIICPFQYTVALFENGIFNGGRLCLNEEVIKIETLGSDFVIHTKKSIFKTKFIINAAGIYADKIHNMVLPEEFSINSRLGEYIIFNKDQGELFDSTIFQCPSINGKGVLVSKTVHGNLFIGPSATNIASKDDVSTTEDGLEYIKKMAKKTSRKIDFKKPLKNYAGNRAIPSTDDFIIKNSKKLKNFIDVAGIKSPGLTCAPAIAKDVVLILKDVGLKLREKENFYPIRKQINFLELTSKEKNEIILKDKNFGKIICSCENITKGEILDAMDRCFGVPSVGSIKRRCRASMGRCQGNYCVPIIVKMISRKYNIPENLVNLDSNGSNMLLKRTK